MKIAIYSRVSTTEQTVEPQLFALRAYAHARGFEVVEEYVDAGVSGARDRRPALDRLVADARRRRFDVLVTTKLDRLARSVRHLTTLAGELEALGVGLVVLDQAIDTTTPTGRLLFNMLGSIAEFERNLIRERTRTGMAAAKRRGARIGRPVAALDEVKLVRGMRSGSSVSALARELGVARSTLRRQVAKRVRAGAVETAAAAQVETEA